MVSNGISMPLIETLQANEEYKGKLLGSTQHSLKKVQDVASHLLENEKLAGNEKEVQQLCESLFRILLHGLRQISQGYWQFVREFTHHKTIQNIQVIQLTDNPSFGWSWAWLLIALNENCLESYFRSFLQNPHIVNAYYRQPALLRDRQRMELLITLVAGLEHVSFCLPMTKDYIESISKNVASEKKKHETESYNKTVEVDTSSLSSGKSLQEEDSGVVDFENGIEIVNQEEKMNCFGESWPVADRSCNCCDCEKSLMEERRRISHILSLDTSLAKDISAETTSMEVIRAKITRRCKRQTDGSKEDRFQKDGQSKKDKCLVVENNSNSKDVEMETSGLLQADENTNASQSDENTCSLFSKTMRDSGLSIEFDDDNCKSPVNDSSKEKLLFNVNLFQKDLDFMFSMPSAQHSECSDFTGDSAANDILWLAERGVPEGQEDPILNTDDKEDTPLLSRENESVEEEISIYDLNKKCCDRDDHSHDSSSFCDDKTDIVDDALSIVAGSLPSEIHLEDKKKYVNICDSISEIEEIPVTNKNDDSFRPDSNTLLYLTLEILDHEDEEFYKMFPSFVRHLEGIPEVVFILLTNKCLYLLRPGDAGQKLQKEACIKFRDIDYICVGLNYQGFLIVCIDRQRRLDICTRNENLTRSIISHLEVAMRRSQEVTSLPCVFTNLTAQEILLKQFVAEVLNCEVKLVDIHHYALVHWENYLGHKNPIFSTPAGPYYHGFLMYRYQRGIADSNLTWEAGYFVLKNGILFCFGSKEEKEVNFFLQLCVPHCRGCRRLPLADRPHVFELLISNQDSLQLAAADDYEASVWLQSFLQAVCQAGHFLDTEPTYQACSVVIANDSIMTAQAGSFKKTHKLLGSAKMRDLIKIYVENDVSVCCILEFESGEAERCSGEWILFFASPEEREKFMEVLFRNWEKLHNSKLFMSSIKDLSLLEKCKEMSYELTKERLLLPRMFQQLD